MILNEYCGICGVTSATKICLCERPVVRLCEDHISQHMNAKLKLGHNILKIEMLLKVGTEEFERCLRRNDRIALVRGQVKKDIESVSKAMNDFSAATQRVLEANTLKAEEEVMRIIVNAKRFSSSLLSHSSEKLEALNTLKNELEAQTLEALNEVEQTLETEHPHMSSKYGYAFRSLLENTNTFSLFSFKIEETQSTPLIETRVYSPEEIIGGEQPSAPERNKFAAVFGNHVELYDLKTGESVKHPITVDFGKGGSYIELNRNTLLGVGANPTFREVYSLDLSSLVFIPLPPLNLPRQGTGLAKVAHFVYAFGGSNDSSVLSSCEKFHVEDRKWLRVRDMHYPRSYLTPCLFRSVVYLASGSTHVMEAFRPQTEDFTDLGVTLPPQFETDPYSMAFVARGELCLLTTKQLARWKIESTSVGVSTTNKKCWSTQPPYVMDSQVLIANWGSVQKFSLETYSYI